MILIGGKSPAAALFIGGSNQDVTDIQLSESIMTDRNEVTHHYTHGGLLAAIRAGLEQLGKTPQSVTVDDLGPVEEFHIGGRVASEIFLDQLALSANDHVLDVGCGLGGTSRFVASRYASHIFGIDLTKEYIDTGRSLCAWVGLEHLITLEQGSATSLPCADATFDKSYMLHVGMNIADKNLLATEVSRVLKPGGKFGIYDIMRIGPGDLSFPVPWATTKNTSFVASSDDYKLALDNAGFDIVSERNRHNFALDFFDKLKANSLLANGPPALGTHILMGATAPEKVQNIVENLTEGRLAPIELIAQKRKC
jgi:SAM-dependent methyltransferase